MAVNIPILVRLVAAVGMCMFGAFVGGWATGTDMWGFIEKYSLPYYVGVAVVGFTVINPALKSRRS